MVYKAQLAGGVIINKENEILLVYNKETDSWTYPKGHVEPGETELETALREIKEEAGLEELELVCKLPVYERRTRQDPDKIKVMNMFFFKSRQNGVKSNTTDVTNLKWVPKNCVAAYFSYPEEVEFYVSVKNMLNYSE